MKGVKIMTVKTKRWDSVATDVNTLCQEIEEFCNSQEVESIQTFSFGRWFVLVVLLKTDKNKED